MTNRDERPPRVFSRYFRAAVEALVLNRNEEARRLFVFRDVSVFPSFTTTSTRATTKTTLINRTQTRFPPPPTRDAVSGSGRSQSGEVPVIVRGGRRDFRSRDVRRRGGGNRGLRRRGRGGLGRRRRGLGRDGLGRGGWRRQSGLGLRFLFLGARRRGRARAHRRRARRVVPEERPRARRDHPGRRARPARTPARAFERPLQLPPLGG